MTNKQLIELSQGALSKDWHLRSMKSPIPTKGLIDSTFPVRFHREKLIHYFKKWEIDLFSISRIMFGAKPYRKPSDVESVSCIYFLIQDFEIIYIGKTKNLYERMNGHLQGCIKKEFNKISIHLMPEGDLNNYEWPYISKFLPYYNWPNNRPKIIEDMHSVMYSRRLHLSDEIANAPVLPVKNLIYGIQGRNNSALFWAAEYDENSINVLYTGKAYYHRNLVGMARKIIESGNMENKTPYKGSITKAWQHAKTRLTNLQNILSNEQRPID